MPKKEAPLVHHPSFLTPPPPQTKNIGGKNSINYFLSLKKNYTCRHGNKITTSTMLIDSLHHAPLIRRYHDTLRTEEVFNVVCDTRCSVLMTILSCSHTMSLNMSYNMIPPAGMALFVPVFPIKIVEICPFHIPTSDTRCYKYSGNYHSRVDWKQCVMTAWSSLGKWHMQDFKQDNHFVKPQK